MDERLMQFRVGVMVLASFIITGVLILLFGDFPTLVQGNYLITMHFDQAPGVMQDTPVRKNGILIGRVRNVEFDEKEGGVLVSARVNSDVPLFTYELPRVEAGLLGDATIEFVTTGNIPAEKRMIAPDSRLEGEVAPSPIEAFSDLQVRLNGAFDTLEKTGRSVDEATLAIRQTATAFTQTSEQWTQVGHQINGMLTGDQAQDVQKLVRRSQETMDNLNKAFANLDNTVTEVRKLVADPELQGNIRRSAEELPKALVDARNAIGGLQRTVSTAEQNLKNLEGITKPLGERGGELIVKLDSGISKLDVVLAQLQIFSKNLNSPDSTIGQLVNNPDLYQTVQQAALNIEELTRELKPIVRDVRVVSDKLARHPEQLGVRGAITRPSAGLK